MRHTTALLAAALLLAGGAVGCSSEKSYEEITADCAAALKERPDGDKTKPAACEGVKEDDYQTLLMSHVLEENGMVKDGEVDMDKMLNPDQP